MSSRTRTFVALALCLLWLSVMPATAQLGKLIPKKDSSPQQAPQGVGAPPEYTEKDKQEMEKIAQQKEVKELIERQWTEMRHRDLDFAYRVNLSNRVSTEGAMQAADVRSNFGQLYDNPIVVRYVNALGQRLVPKDSPNVFAFRILLDPEPRAETISTGTVYVSTGLISMLDNEAQLSYVLAHEIAHVERNHFYNGMRNSILEEMYWQQKEESAQRKRALFTMGMGVAGGLIGKAAGGWTGAAWGTGIGVAGGAIAGSFLFRNKFIPTAWSIVYEDEADEMAVKYMLEQNYDAREVPRLYAALERAVKADARLGLGFIGNPARVKERTSKVQALLGGNLKADIDRRLKEAGLTGVTGDYNVTMSALKRDNGIVALEYDLFAEARYDLEEAVAQRSTDPLAHYYLGKVLALTGRSQEDKQQAVKYFQTAIKLDAGRLAFADPHLDYALYLINQQNPSHQEILNELKTFVLLYQREHGGNLPPNMHILYDYFLLAGDTTYYVPPVSVVSTMWAEPVNTSGTPPPPMRVRVGRAMAETAAMPAAAPAESAAGAKPAAVKAPVKKTAAPAAKPGGQN